MSEDNKKLKDKLVNTMFGLAAVALLSSMTYLVASTQRQDKALAAFNASTPAEQFKAAQKGFVSIECFDVETATRTTPPLAANVAGYQKQRETCGIAPNF